MCFLPLFPLFSTFFPHLSSFFFIFFLISVLTPISYTCFLLFFFLHLTFSWEPPTLLFSFFPHIIPFSILPSLLSPPLTLFSLHLFIEPSHLPPLSALSLFFPPSPHPSICSSLTSRLCLLAGCYYSITLHLDNHHPTTLKWSRAGGGDKERGNQQKGGGGALWHEENGGEVILNFSGGIIAHVEALWRLPHGEILAEMQTNNFYTSNYHQKHFSISFWRIHHNRSFSVHTGRVVSLFCGSWKQTPFRPHGKL